MHFSTTMSQMGNNTGIEVPAEVIEELDGGRKPAVTVSVNGYGYRSTVAVMGGRYLIPFSSDKRTASGIGGGDAIEVELELDTEPRTVEIPADLDAALDAVPPARATFDKLSPSNRKAHVTSIEAAKTDATRASRIEAAVSKLAAS